MNKRLLFLLALPMAAGLLIAACVAPPVVVPAEQPSPGAEATAIALPAVAAEDDGTEVSATAVVEEADGDAGKAAGEDAAEADTAETEQPEDDQSDATTEAEDAAADPDPLAVDPERPGFTLDGSPTLGDPDAPIVVLDFFDFQ